MHAGRAARATEVLPLFLQLLLRDRTIGLYVEGSLKLPDKDNGRKKRRVDKSKQKIT